MTDPSIDPVVGVPLAFAVGWFLLIVITLMTWNPRILREDSIRLEWAVRTWWGRARLSCACVGMFPLIALVGVAHLVAWAGSWWRANQPAIYREDDSA